VKMRIREGKMGALEGGKGSKERTERPKSQARSELFEAVGKRKGGAITSRNKEWWGDISGY